MSDSIRQQIITALDTRLKTITTANGYQSNAGLKVYDWLDRELADADLDAIVYRDVSNQFQADYFCGTGNRLRIEIEGRTKQASTTAAQIRKIVADIYAAVGTDETFGGLACETNPVSDELNIQQADKIMALATVVLDVYYLCNRWTS